MIVGNIISNGTNTGAGDFYGIHLTASVDDAQVYSNLFESLDVEDINDLGTGTITVDSKIDAAIAASGFPKANKKWADCKSQFGFPPAAFENTGAEWRNLGATDFSLVFGCGLPLHLEDGKALHIDQVRICLSDGDSTDYMDRIVVYGLNESGGTIILDNGDNWWTLNTNRDLTLSTEYDADTYVGIGIRIYVVATTANDFGLRYIQVRYWYE